MKKSQKRYQLKQSERGLIRVHPYVPVDKADEVRDLAKELREGGITDAQRLNWVFDAPERVGAVREEWAIRLNLREAIDHMIKAGSL